MKPCIILCNIRLIIFYILESKYLFSTSFKRKKLYIFKYLVEMTLKMSTISFVEKQKL